MPTYEYACTVCGQHVEVFQRLSEPPLELCGACGGPMRKVFHPAGILFKGSGFYTTDSRAKSTAPSSDSGSSTEGKKPEPSGASKPESKPESKPASKPTAKEKSA